MDKAVSYIVRSRCLHSYEVSASSKKESQMFIKSTYGLLYWDGSSQESASPWKPGAAVDDNEEYDDDEYDDDDDDDDDEYDDNDDDITRNFMIYTSCKAILGE
jgi:hypothetical protein